MILSALRVGACVFAVAACGGATDYGLLGPGDGPSSSGPDDAASKPQPHPGSSSSGGGNPMDDATSGMSPGDGSSGDDGAMNSQDDGSDDGSEDAAAETGTGAEPASPCSSSCTAGNTCCAKAGSPDYGQCYSFICVFCCN